MPVSVFVSTSTWSRFSALAAQIEASSAIGNLASVPKCCISLEVGRPAARTRSTIVPFALFLFSIVPFLLYPRSSGLDLDRSAVLARGPGCDHQITALRALFTPEDLPDRAHGVDDGGSRRVGGERRQRLQDAAVVRLRRGPQHVGAPRVESRHRGL